MNAKTMNKFINDFWQMLVKPTCEKDEQDYAYLLDTSISLEKKYPEISTMCAKMCLAYINNIEVESRSRDFSRQWDSRVGM